MDDYSEVKYQNQYSLSIRFSSDGYSLFVHDENEILISTKHVDEKLYSLTENEIIQLFKNQPEIKSTYRHTRIICESNSYSLIPTSFFDPQYAPDFLDFENIKQKSEAVLFNRVQSFNIVNVFSIPAAFYKSLASVFPYCNPEHHVSFLLNEQLYKSNKTVFHLLLRIGWVDILVTSGNLLQFANRFEYRTAEDLLYYTLNVFEQLNIDAENSPVVMYNSKENSDIMNLLSKYLEVIEK